MISRTLGRERASRRKEGKNTRLEVPTGLAGWSGKWDKLFWKAVCGRQCTMPCCACCGCRIALLPLTDGWRIRTRTIYSRIPVRVSAKPPGRLNILSSQQRHQSSERITLSRRDNTSQRRNRPRTSIRLLPTLIRTHDTIPIALRTHGPCQRKPRMLGPHKVIRDNGWELKITYIRCVVGGWD